LLFTSYFIFSIVLGAFLYVSLADVLSTNERLKGVVSELLVQQDELFTNYSRLVTNYDALNASYRQLVENYRELQSAYSELLSAYASLSANHTSLSARFKDLNASYVELMHKYEKLRHDYDVLYTVLYKPLENKTVPRVDELKAWLKEDPTDTIQYRDPDFVCGDFAMMLSFHAKLKGWDMGGRSSLRTRCGRGEVQPCIQRHTLRRGARLCRGPDGFCLVE